MYLAIFLLSVIPACVYWRRVRNDPSSSYLSPLSSLSFLAARDQSQRTPGDGPSPRDESKRFARGRKSSGNSRCDEDEAMVQQDTHSSNLGGNEDIKVPGPIESPPHPSVPACAPASEEEIDGNCNTSGSQVQDVSQSLDSRSSESSNGIDEIQESKQHDIPTTAMPPPPKPSKATKPIKSLHSPQTPRLLKPFEAVRQSPTSRLRASPASNASILRGKPTSNLTTEVSRRQGQGHRPGSGSGSGSLAPSNSTLAPPSRAPGKVILAPGHSPLDWAALTTSPPSSSFLRGSDVPVGKLIRVTPSLLNKHNGRKNGGERTNAWGVYQGKVYNMTPYMDFHPGGPDQLMRGAGKEKDGERLFMEIHPWINWDNMLGECLVGIMVGEGEGEDDDGHGDSVMDEMD